MLKFDPIAYDENEFTSDEQALQVLEELNYPISLVMYCSGPYPAYGQKHDIQTSVEAISTGRQFWNKRYRGNKPEVTAYSVENGQLKVSTVYCCGWIKEAELVH